MNKAYVRMLSEIRHVPPALCLKSLMIVQINEPINNRRHSMCLALAWELLFSV